MAPTYAQYDIATVAHNGNHYYGKEYNYSDYRQMIKEAAEETNVKYVNSWNYLKDYFDYNPLDGSKRGTYYNDIVHLSVKGQQVLAEYLAGGMVDWYLNGEFADSLTDADYQFSKVSDTKVRLNLTITRKELEKGFVITDGKTVIDGSSIASASYLSISSDKKISLTEEGEYVIEIDLTSNNVTITKESAPVIYYTTFDSSSAYARIRAAYLNTQTGLYEFEVDFIQWGSIQINYNGEYLSTLETAFSGEYTETYPGTSSTKLYPADNMTTTFFCANAAGASYTFVYDPIANTLTINPAEVEVIPGLIYGGKFEGTATENSDGTYSFSLEFDKYGILNLTYNGVPVNATNTNITGAFKNQQKATWTKDFYIDETNSNNLVYYTSGSDKYNFIYTPATDTTKASLVIEWIEPEVSADGLAYVIEANIDASSANVVKNSDGTYTLTFTTTANWAVIDLYYNGELLTWSNVTATGDVCSAYATMNGAANILYFGSDSGIGWCAYDDGANGGETYTLVFNPTGRTLVVSYK